MEKLSIAFSIFISLLISVVIGFFLYALLDALRADLYCPDQFREGADCYMEGWDIISTWVASTVGSLMAIMAIASVSLFQPKRRYKSAKATLFVGAICAAPFALLIQSVTALLATVLSGVLALWCVKRLTSRSSKDALTRAA